MALSDDILAEDDIEVEAVDIPEWHRKLWMRGLTGEERDAYESSRRQVRNMGTPQQELILINDNMRANLIVKCLVDENRERIFTDRQAPALGQKNGKVLDRLFDVAARLSGLTDEEAEQIEGNSEAVQSDGSTSSSPETSDAPSGNSYGGSVPAN
jgi:hypothetical protein